MKLYKTWRAERRHRQEQRVLDAIGMLRPERASAYPIGRLAGLSPAGAFPILARLERRGLVTSEWVDGPIPRRRVYRVREVA